MSIVKLIFLFQLLFTAICGCESRECVGDGIYVDFPREETRKAGERSDGRHCSDIPHNLKMFEDEDTPTSACNHKYCPSCILVLREYCLPLDDKNFCQPLRALAWTMYAMTQIFRTERRKFVRRSVLIATDCAAMSSNELAMRPF
ncbi:hypothetical protein DdX_14740 [Ditylenchus destructor]|uniref:Uncharacterized protein n=1 Tax=Ditylenchus destructor TaxID=166010 RepID=A0AAD4R1N3_9BILA|nr:hypothetical protein DdX_14740 [Ditylenchus destructor]